MNLNCNCIKNRYMDPNLSVFVRVQNLVPNCFIFLKLHYFYDGKWYDIKSNVFAYNKCARLYYEKSSFNRDFTIFKHTNTKDIFIFHTIISSDSPVCFNVTGSSDHTLIHQVPC